MAVSEAPGEVCTQYTNTQADRDGNWSCRSAKRMKKVIVSAYKFVPACSFLTCKFNLFLHLFSRFVMNKPPYATFLTRYEKEKRRRRSVEVLLAVMCLLL